MKYSPKLKKAMSEIKEVLEKYDIAGMIVLHTEGGHSEYLLKINPSYSVIKFEGPNRLLFRAKLQEDFNGNKRLMQHKLANTSNMLKHITDVGGELVLSVIKVSEQFDSIVDGRHTSQNELDN